MKASRKHHYSIAQNHVHLQLIQQFHPKSMGQTHEETELLRGTDTTDHQLHLEGQQVFASCLDHPS